MRVSPSMQMKKITFSSAHKKMHKAGGREIERKWGWSGEPLKPVWPAGEGGDGSKISIVSHTRQQRVHLIVVLDVQMGVDQSLRGTLVGHPVESSDPAFEFRSPVALHAGKNGIRMKGAAPLADWPTRLERTIEWTFESGQGRRPVCTSGLHVVYVTFGGPIINYSEPNYPAEIPALPEEGVTPVRMRAATQKIEKAGPCDAVELLHRLFSEFPHHVLGYEQLPPAQHEQVEREPTLKETLDLVGWAKFLRLNSSDDEFKKWYRQGGVWPLADFQEFSAECQAIVRFIRAILRQVGFNRGAIDSAYAGATVEGPNSPIRPTFASKGALCRCIGPRSGQKNVVYTLVDHPVSTGRIYLYEELLAETGMSDFEAYLLYRYEEQGQRFQVWYPGGGGGKYVKHEGWGDDQLPIEKQREILSLSFAGMAEGELIRYGDRLLIKITEYWPFPENP